MSRHYKKKMNRAIKKEGSSLNEEDLKELKELKQLHKRIEGKWTFS
jgi:hypothetical protein